MVTGVENPVVILEDQLAENLAYLQNKKLPVRDRMQALHAATEAMHAIAVLVEVFNAPYEEDQRGSNQP